MSDSSNWDIPDDDEGFDALIARVLREPRAPSIAPEARAEEIRQAVAAAELPVPEGPDSVDHEAQIESSEDRYGDEVSDEPLGRDLHPLLRDEDLDDRFMAETGQVTIDDGPADLPGAPAHVDDVTEEFVIDDGTDDFDPDDLL